MDDEAVKDLGLRIGKLELGQALVLKGLDSLTTRSDQVLVELKIQNGRIDDHEVRIRLREVAYEERVLPAMNRLRNLELKVAGSAVVGGGMVYLITEVAKLIGGT